MVRIKGRVKCYTERFKSLKGGWMPFFGGNALNFPMGKQVSLMKQKTHAILAQVFEPEMVRSRTGEGRSQMPEGKKKERRPKPNSPETRCKLEFGEPSKCSSKFTSPRNGL